MDITLAGSVIARPLSSDQMGRITVELSADGTEVGTGTIVIDDPAGTDEIAGGRQARIDEGTTLISDGFIAGQDKSRNGRRDRPRREDIYQFQDANVLFYGKRFVNRSRPAETDRARVLAFAAADLPAADTTMVLSTNTRTLPAKKYTGSDWTELMTDVLEATGKLIFLHDLADGSGRCLHSHKETEGHTCGLTISDVATQTATTYNPWNANRNRNSGTLTNDVVGRDQDNRSASDSDSGSITAHDADGLKHQSVVEFEARSQAELAAKTSAHVDENKDEVDSYECDIGPLDEDALALIRPGDRITVTSQAMALSTSTIRIAHLSLSLARDKDGQALPGQWMAHLELNEAIRLRPRVSSGSKHVTKNEMLRTVKPFCIPGPQEDTFTRTTTGLGLSEFEGGREWETISAGVSVTTDGDEAVLISDDDVSSKAVAAITLPFTGRPVEALIEFSLDASLVDSTGYIWFGTALSQVVMARPSMRVIIDLSAGDLDTNFGTAVPGAGTAGFSDSQTGVSDGTTVWIRMMIDDLGIYGSVSVSSPPDSTYDHFAAYPFNVADVPTLLEIGATGNVASASTFRVSKVTILQGLPEVCADPGSETPLYGQSLTEIIGIGDGTTTAFSLSGPYIQGSLHITVDDLDEHNVTGDPLTGAVVFSEPPFATEVIRATRLAAV